MINPVKNQHYVPAFLLRNFLNSNSLLWTFDKEHYLKGWSHIDEKAVKSVASAEYFYEKEINSVEDSLEYQLGQIENGVAPIVQRLITSVDLGSISSDEKQLLALFIALQLNRTKESLLETKRINSQLMTFLKQFVMVPPEAENPRAIWIDQIHNAKQYADVILKKTWAILHCGGGLYISDNPVVRGNYINKDSLRGVLGLNSDGIEIYLPLCGSVAIALYCERTHVQMVEGTHLMNDQNVLYINSHQVIQSGRFIFSSGNEFTLAAEMLNENHSPL